MIASGTAERGAIMRLRRGTAAIAKPNPVNPRSIAAQKITATVPPIVQSSKSIPSKKPISISIDIVLPRILDVGDTIGSENVAG
jgi:hypothetical protein